MQEWRDIRLQDRAEQAEGQAAIDAAEGGSRPKTCVERFGFYDLAKQAYAVVQTGECRLYGCFMLRKGVIAPEEDATQP